MNKVQEIHKLNWQIANLRCRLGVWGYRPEDISGRRRIQRLINTKLAEIRELEKQCSKGLFITDI